MVTEDGYILTVHRIPSYAAQPHVVFLQHGLMSSSADWVLTGPDHALAFLLADAGYDVWMGNFRGNTYSRDHMQQDISPTKYWVGWHKGEQGVHILDSLLKEFHLG